MYNSSWEVIRYSESFILRNTKVNIKKRRTYDWTLRVFVKKHFTVTRAVIIIKPKRIKSNEPIEEWQFPRFPWGLFYSWHIFWTWQKLETDDKEGLIIVRDNMLSLEIRT